uniref:Uncharacterized protein n=1 Tax=Glossina palpalis gambiensis TaxID=67801 RepID=A0A1B0AYF8_9MUSC
MQCINPNSCSNNVEFFSYTLNDNNENDDNDKNDDPIDDVPRRIYPMRIDIELIHKSVAHLFATVGDDNYLGDDDDNDDDDDDDDDDDYGRILFLKFSKSTDVDTRKRPKILQITVLR